MQDPGLYPRLVLLFVLCVTLCYSVMVLMVVMRHYLQIMGFGESPAERHRNIGS